MINNSHPNNPSNGWKLLLLFIVSLFCSQAFSQSYLGNVSKQVNLREGPGRDYPVIKSLKPDTQIFILSLETENGFYSVIDILSDKSGYVHKNYIRVGKELPQNDGGLFTPMGSSGSENPEVEVFNNTSKTMTLKLNSVSYTFIPKEKKTLTLSATTYSFIASAPGVIPNYGSERLNTNTRYSWEFYIVTRYR